jgi:hypothetical protein
MKRKNPGPTEIKEPGMIKTDFNEQGQEFDPSTCSIYTDEPDIVPTERSSTRFRIAQEVASDRGGYHSVPSSSSSSISSSSSSSSLSSGFNVPAPTNPGDFRLYQREKIPSSRSSFFTRDELNGAVTDWGTFGHYMDQAHQRTQDALEEDRRARERGVRVAPAGVGFIDTEGTKKLADFVGRSNYGVRYRPYLSAKPSATSWLAGQKLKAKSQKEIDEWNRWQIETADLDDDDRTPDNVITYSDFGRGR